MTPPEALAAASSGLPGASGEDAFKILWMIVVLAFMIERALSVLFEHRLWRRLEGDFRLGGLKELVAVLLAFGLCGWSGFDALALMFRQASGWPTRALTALIIAGGSKGAIRLMQDVLGVKNAPAPSRSAVPKR